MKEHFLWFPNASVSETDYTEFVNLRHIVRLRVERVQDQYLPIIDLVDDVIPLSRPTTLYKALDTILFFEGRIDLYFEQQQEGQ